MPVCTYMYVALLRQSSVTCRLLDALKDDVRLVVQGLEHELSFTTRTLPVTINITNTIPHYRHADCYHSSNSSTAILLH